MPYETHDILKRFALLGLLLAALMASSCAKQLPTAAGGPAERVEDGWLGADDDERIENQVVVTLASGADPQAIAADYGATLVSWNAEYSLAVFAPGAGQSPAELVLAMTGDVRLTTQEANGPVVPAEARQKSFAFDDGLGTMQNTIEQPAAEAIGLPAAHRVSTGGGVKVAILDTGIDPTHPMFRGRIVGSRDFLEPTNLDAIEMADGIDNDGNDAIDEAYGHGTHVAGIVAISAPDAMLLIGRVLDADGRGDVLAVAAGIRWAVQSGAKVINLSLGTLTHSDAIMDALEYAEHRDVVVVASAGNWGAESPQEFPARSSHTFAIAASDASRHPATFTSFGSFVELCAPGVAVRSAFPGGAYRLWSGTSMSTPFVAGTAALLLAVHPDWSPSRVMNRIGDTASQLVGTSSAQHEKLGDGMLNAAEALAPDYVPSAAPLDDPVEVPATVR